MSDNNSHTGTSSLSSPTALAAKRLGNRISNPTEGSVADQSIRSRRSPSCINTSEDAQVFEQMSASTEVRVATAAQKTRAHAAATSSTPTSSVTGLMHGVESLIRSFSPGTVPSASSNESPFSFDNISHSDEPRKDLDLKHNDNSFHVLAQLIVELVESRQGQSLQWEDRVTLERLLPSPHSFLEAVRYRLERTPARPTTPLQTLTLQCQKLGFDEENVEANPILAALAMLPPPDEEKLEMKQSETTPDAFSAASAAARAAAKAAAVATGMPGPVTPTPPEEPCAPSSSFSVDPAAATRVEEQPSVTTPSSANLAMVTRQTFSRGGEDIKADDQRSTGLASAFSEVAPTPTSVKAENPFQATAVEPPSVSLRALSVDEQTQLEEKKKAVEASVAKELDEASRGEFDPHHTDTMARKQLLAELREAKKLTQESVTPETAQFWQNHVSDLETRLRALQGETACSPRAQVAAPAAPVDIVENNRRLMSQFQQQDHHYSPPSPTLEASRSKESSIGAAGGEAANHHVKPSHSHLSGSVPDYEAPMVDVVSPADLPGGYHFEAEIEGQRFLATVPAGGVQQGETFTCYMRKLDSVAIDIPVGYWKDEPTDICKYGCCHPVFWSSIICPLIPLGQIQHRVDLDFLGRPRTMEPAVANRTMMLTVIAFWILINIGLFIGYNIKWSRGFELTNADWAAFALVNGGYVAFAVFVTQSTRSSLREKFLIREQRCYDLEDLCCATWCMSCTVAQMSRHTANYDDYEAVLCAESGLPDGVRVNQQPAVKDSGYVV